MARGEWHFLEYPKLVHVNEFMGLFTPFFVGFFDKSKCGATFGATF